MMLIRLFFAAAITLLATRAFAQLPGQNYPIKAENWKFTFQTFDGETVNKCKHLLTDELAHDWRVECFDDKGQPTQKYNVHLWVTAYERNVNPQLSLEVLYWVTDITNASPIGSSSTIWFHMKDKTYLDSVQISQGVSHDTAGLYLEIKW